jgi:hypothetical protein
LACIVARVVSEAILSGTISRFAAFSFLVAVVCESWRTRILAVRILEFPFIVQHALLALALVLLDRVACAGTVTIG